MTPKCFPLKQLTHYLPNFCEPGVQSSLWASQAHRGQAMSQSRLWARCRQGLWSQLKALLGNTCCKFRQWPRWFPGQPTSWLLAYWAYRREPSQDRATVFLQPNHESTLVSLLLYSVHLRWITKFSPCSRSRPFPVSTPVGKEAYRPPARLLTDLCHFIV